MASWQAQGFAESICSKNEPMPMLLAWRVPCWLNSGAPIKYIKFLFVSPIATCAEPRNSCSTHITVFQQKSAGSALASQAGVLFLMTVTRRCCGRLACSVLWRNEEQRALPQAALTPLLCKEPPLLSIMQCQAKSHGTLTLEVQVHALDARIQLLKILQEFIVSPAVPALSQGRDML